MVSTYTFSNPKFGASILQIDDIGEVIEHLVNTVAPCLEGVAIAGAKNLFTFKTNCAV